MHSLFFALVMSWLMAFLMSGVLTALAIGLPPDFLSRWLQGWLTAWAIAFPAVMLIAPIARRIAGMVVEAVPIPKTQRRPRRPVRNGGQPWQISTE